MTVTKEKLRKLMQKKLTTLNEIEREQISKQLQNRLFASKLWQQAETIAIYLSFGNEWDTRAIVEKAWRLGKKVAIPKTIPERKKMNFYQINDFSEVQKGYFNIEEPLVEKTILIDKNNIDLLVVPGLVFTKDGYRIGFGGGYYDRFLTDFVQPTVSLASTKQLVDDFPVEPFDIPVNYLLTEEGFVE